MRQPLPLLWLEGVLTGVRLVQIHGLGFSDQRLQQRLTQLRVGAYCINEHLHIGSRRHPPGAAGRRRVSRVCLLHFGRRLYGANNGYPHGVQQYVGAVRVP